MTMLDIAIFCLPLFIGVLCVVAIPIWFYVIFRMISAACFSSWLAFLKIRNHNNNPQ